MSAPPTYVYTLVAYRANGVDTCRNCVMGQSDSDFELSVSLDAESLAASWAHHRLNAPRGREYCGYEYTLLINGRDDNNDADWDDAAHCDPETGEPWTYLERKRVAALAEARYAELVREKEAEAARQAAAAQARRLAELRTAEEQKERAERAEFARLSVKFAEKPSPSAQA